MKNSKVLKTILIVSGLVGAAVGCAILFMPAAFHATNGIELGGNISLLNEIRASGGALLAGGILILLGAFIASLAFTSVVVSGLLYLSYGSSRVFSMAIDGMPDVVLVQVAILEILIGLTCVVALVRYRQTG